MKPHNVSTKDYLIKKIAVNKVIQEKMISEKIIDSVITHQFESANLAMQTNNIVELSGFGKFTFNTKKANSAMMKYINSINFYYRKLEEGGISEYKKTTLLKKIQSAQDSIDALKPKLYHE